MSLLGPDDFDLDRKGRAKKLAQDLAPELRKQVEKWLEENDEEIALRKLTELVGAKEARRLLHLKNDEKNHSK